MDRPTFTPVFEESEEVIRARVMARVSDDWRKEPGDFIYDAVAPSPAEVKQLQINQDFILQCAFAQYANDEYLDLKVADVGLTRQQATYNRRSLTVIGDAGVRIPKSYTLNAVVLDSEGNPLAYTTDDEIIFDGITASWVLGITCLTAGSIGNIAAGSQFILQPAIAGVSSIVDNGTDILAEDIETDQQLWERYKLGAQNPDTGGNINDYVRWVQDNIAGVGKAVCIPRWNGNGTVEVVIVGVDFEPASIALVAATQEYLDPLEFQGLGYGKAPIGASVTVVSATDKPINITANVSYSVGADPGTVAEAFQVAVKAYLKSIVFVKNTSSNILYPVAYNKIGALLINTSGVENYSGLLVNGAGDDVALVTWEVATLGTVVL